MSRDVGPVEIVAATAGLQVCPDCGAGWAERRAVVHSNHVAVYDRFTRQLAGYRAGHATAALSLTCTAGHRIELKLRAVYKDGQIGGWQVQP